MNKEFKMFIWAIGLGMSIVGFAFTNFATKDHVNTMHEDIRIIQEDVKKLIER